MEKIIFKIRESKINKALILVLAVTILVPVSFALAEIKNDSQPYPAELYAQCFDKKDNDGDGKTDLEDADCPKCFDGQDNDNDRLIDTNDPDCPKTQAKTNFWKNAAAAIFGIQTKEDINKGSSLNNGGAINAGGYIDAGGSIGTSDSGCIGLREVYITRKVRTANGFYYTRQFVGCDDSLSAPPDLEDTADRRTRVGGFIQPGGNLVAGGDIQAGGEIKAGGNIPAGGEIVAGGEIKAGGYIDAGGEIVAGGSI